MAGMVLVEFVETPVFSKQASSLLDDDSLRKFQEELARDPEHGEVIRGTGGARKVRWAGSGRGKRGGLRVLYYWAPRDQVVFLLGVFAKNEVEDLSDRQKKDLARVVRGLR